MTEKQREARVVTAATRLLKLFGQDGEHWTYGHGAEDKTGELVQNYKSRKAVKWCLSAAMAKLKISPDTVIDLRGKLPVPTTWGNPIIEFNDSHKTYTHVRRFLEKIVKKSRKK